MSLYGYKPKWGKRAYLGPAALARATIHAASKIAKLNDSTKRTTRAFSNFRQVVKTARKRIKSKSPKAAKSDRLYMADAKAFLALPENKFCRVAWLRDGKKIPATENHHIRGRHRTLKFDRRFFCPTSFFNGRWIHNNIEAARQLGVLAQSGEWHNAPADEETKRLENWMREKGI